MAAPNNQTTTQAAKANNFVVPVAEETPAHLQEIAPPECVVIQQFSQNSDKVQSSTNNN